MYDEQLARADVEAIRYIAIYGPRTNDRGRGWAGRGVVKSSSRRQAEEPCSQDGVVDGN
jgi:hypothetical protein